MTQPGRSASRGRSAPGAGDGPPAAGGLAALAALGVVEAAALAGMAWIPSARAVPAPAFLLWGVAWTAMAAGWALVRRGGPAAGLLDGRQGRAVVWAVAVGARLALLPADPHFSDDVYRYLWDGWVSLKGVNPYLHAPDAAALEPLRTAWHGLVNHPSVATIYPPGAQAVFHGLAVLGPSVLLFKAAWVAADLGVGWVLDRLDRRRPGPGRALLLWLWSPLVIVEVAWSGHLEPLGVLPMVAALLWLDGREAGGDGTDRGEADRGGRAEHPAGGPAVGGALLGLGAAVKFAPAAALPALVRRHGWRALAAAALVPAALLVPYLDAGGALLSGLGEYASRWEFNAGLFLALRSAVGADAARLVGGLVPAAIAVAAAWRGREVGPTLFWCLGAALLLSPTLHPWYLLWILPFAALRGSPSWILWTGTIFLAYAGLDAYRATGHWPEPPLLRGLVHLPFLALLAAAGLQRAGRVLSRHGG